MSERLEQELSLVRACYPELEVREEDLWARIPQYPLPEGWGRTHVEVAFQVPRDFFAQQPYGFWVRPRLTLPGGAPPSNSSGPVTTGFGDGWQQFSWAPDGWQPGPEPAKGDNLLHWVRSFRRRLTEIS
jgi:Prokaryotic E2 family E